MNDFADLDKEIEEQKDLIEKQKEEYQKYIKQYQAQLVAQFGAIVGGASLGAIGAPVKRTHTVTISGTTQKWEGVALNQVTPYIHFVDASGKAVSIVPGMLGIVIEED